MQPYTLHPTPYTIHPTPYTLNRSESAQNTDSTQAIDSGCFAARPDTHSISPPPPHHTPATAALPRTGIARVAGRVHHLPHRLPLVSSCAPRVSEGLVTCTPPRPAAPSPISAYAITSPDQPITHNPPIPNPETLKPAPRAATGVPQIDPPPPHPHRSPTRLYQRLTNEGPVATTAACRGSFTLLLLVKDPLLPLSARTQEASNYRSPCRTTRVCPSVLPGSSNASGPGSLSSCTQYQVFALRLSVGALRAQPKHIIRYTNNAARQALLHPGERDQGARMLQVAAALCCHHGSFCVNRALLQCSFAGLIGHTCSPPMV